MQRITKVILGVVGLGAVLGVLAGAGILWLSRRIGPTLRDSAKAAHSEGQRAGAALDDSACVAASLDRLRTGNPDSVALLLRENLWVVGCLETSRLNDSLCQAVPSPSAPVQVGLWAARRCDELGIDGHGCGVLLQRVADYCSSPERRQKATRDSGGV